MRALAALILFCSLLAAENLPDAPSTVQPPKKESSWSRLWDGRRARTNREVVRYRPFQIATASLWLSSVWDAETTHAGLAHHRCVEANRNFGYYPSRGELYREMAIENGVVTGLGFLFTKARAPHWIYDGMATYGTVIHAKGAISWYANCW